MFLFNTLRHYIIALILYLFKYCFIYLQRVMKSEKPGNNSTIIIGDLKKEFTSFLQNFTSELSPEPKYLPMIRRMIDAGKHQLIIQFKDLATFNCQLANFIIDEFIKYEAFLNQTLTQFVREYQRNLNGVAEDFKKQDQRQEKYEVSFDSYINPSQNTSVRDLRCQRLGKLFSFRGTITRTTQVRPQLVVGVFRCKSCSNYSKPLFQQFKYTEPKKCLSPNCDKPIWQLDFQKSQIADYQKLRVQQDPTKIPPGAMPRSIDVILRNQNTERGQPGDICRFVGYLCVIPEIASMLKPGQKTTISSRNAQNRGQMMQMQGVKGLKGIKQLNYRLAFISTNLIIENNQFRAEQQDQQYQDNNNNEDQMQVKPVYNQQQIMSKIFSNLDVNEIKLLMELKSNPNLYQDMANSVFPSIFGQSEIKKAILLQLFGGIHKITQNKISIRGDINILIVGDPSTAKSQFLKAVNKFVPRSVYTNGKTTSAAGLTATVTKDDSGTVGIQAGALMLADNGICCIDQFDKMKYTDQTAIHQAMEQQTISIAKAGVYATLNARTSILAAANPLFGRYDKSKSLKNNINISAPIMSRFDLFFVVCDETNDHSDASLSQFIINMHRNKQKALITRYNDKTIKMYIATAKRLKPMLTNEAGVLLRKFYRQMRLRDKATQNTSYRVTVRQLESMIRISQALARLYLDPQIKEVYVREAYNLITTCIMKLQKSPINLIDQELMDNIERELGNKVGLKGDLALQKQLQQKRKQKANKQVSISFEEYQELQKNVLDIFKQKEQIQNKSNEEIQIDQQSLVNYLLGLRFESGLIENVEQTHQMRKILNAVVKKLIREDRILMVVEDSEDLSKKLLKLHPNFVQN